jgi:hypothetical protein
MRLGFLALFAAACTAPVNGPPMDLSGGAPDMPGGSQDLAMVAGMYPPGPYGMGVGSTFPPLVWEGYVADKGDVRVDMRPYGPYSMDDVRKSGKAYAMVHVSAFY